jgi:hypothetical protein
MSFIDAYKSYGSLNDQQKQFLREKRIDAELPTDAWISFMKGVASYDQHGDAMRKAIGWIAAIGIIIGFFGAIFAESAAMLLFAMVGLIALAFYFVLRRVDVPNILREFVLPFITLIREDVAPDDMVHMQLDLRGGTKEEKRKGTDNFEHLGRKIQQKFYNDPWMQGDTKLADGTALQWEISDYIRERQVTKRNPRGKIKVKTKYKVRRTFDVRVGLRGDEYALNATATNPAGGKQSVKQGEKRNVIRTRHSTIGTSLTDVPSMNDLMTPITAAYKRVSLKQENG